jgi:spore coat protein U-like protein
VPTGLSATPGDGEATISFTPGADNGAAITNYAYSLNGDPDITLDPANAGSPITIAGLTNGTPYSITLKAINSEGSSVAASTAVDVTPVGPAGAPTGLLATPGDGEATITFTPGANNGAAITNYEYSVDGVSFDALNPAQAASPITIVGLINLQDYSITLRAINSAGSGAASIAVDVTPGKPALPPTPPDAPTGLSAAPGDSQATISFTPGADNGAAIANYEYSLDGGSYTPLSPASAGSPITIVGLTNGTPYSITLKAINSEGSSVAASAAVDVTPVAAATAPDAPTGLSATPGDGRATISFTPGSNNGAAITNYEYSLDGGSYTALNPAKANSPITIEGLTNDTPYSITLKAINSEGSSVAASAAVVATPVGPPLPPPPPPTPPTPGPAAPIPTMSAYGLGLTVLGVFVVAVRRLRTLAKPK